MTFWGVEVKPNKPFTLKSEDVSGKLILTQATLGNSSSTKKSVLQCNVGDKTPVFLCSLFPEKSECCGLNHEFEEDDDVTFSVIGPTSIHLSGFVHLDPQDCHRDDCDSDSYGEDIAETESEESSDFDSEDYDDDDDDFIDDGDVTMYPTSPIRNSGVVIEEIVDDEKPANKNGGNRQPKKKNQLALCDNDKKAQQQIVVKESTGASMLESEDEDGFPVTSSHNNKSNPEADTPRVIAEDGKIKKKKKNDAKDDNEFGKGLKRKVDAIDRDEANRNAGQENDSTGATKVDPDENTNQKKKKKKKKKKKEKGKAHETDGNSGDAVAVDKDANPGIASENGNVQKLNGGRTLTNDATDVAHGDAEQKKKKKKKKKKAAKTASDEGLANKEQAVSTEDKKMSLADKETKQSKGKPAKVRTFSNGLVIEELAMGKPDGRRASRGSKVSVHYIGKLQKNGKQFDSNIGRAPFKFRLGVGSVIKGWDIGVEGMRVGDKRRLTIPPSMGYGSSGAPPQIPPNAWLVFDVELVNVA